MNVRALLTAQIERVWGCGEVELVDTMYAADVVDRMPIPGQPTGREALKDVVRAFRTAMPDLVMELHGVLAAGDRGVDFWTLTGTHSAPLFGIPPTGRSVRFSGIDMVRVAEGRIAELWHVEEMAQFATQLGVMLPGDPAPVGGVASACWRPVPEALSPVEARNLALAQHRGEALRGDALGMLRAAAPDLQLHPVAYVPSGDYVADLCTMTGTHSGAPLFGIPAQGKRFGFAAMAIAHFDARGGIDRVRHVEELARCRAQIV